MGVSEIELASPGTLSGSGIPSSAVKKKRSIGRPCAPVVWQDRFDHQLAIYYRLL
jgi:hypothetical protein